jgi:hypothetical protein
MKQPPIIRKGFTMGVKTSSEPSVIPYESIYESKNVRADQSGILRIRPGVKAFNESLGIGSIQAVKSAFGEIFAVWNRNVYTFTNVGAPNLIGSNLIGVDGLQETEIISWARSGAEIAYLLAGNGIFETDGATTKLSTPYTPETGESVNLLRKADGTQDTSSGPARSTIACLRASLSMRLALTGDPQSPNTIYLSSPMDGTYYPSDQIIQLPDDGGRITGMTNWYNALIIFRDKDIWAFFGSDVNDSAASLVLQDASIGCVAPRTIVDVPGMGIVFLGADNVYALQQVTGVENQSKAQPIGDDVRKYLLKNMNYLGGCSAVYYDREYHLSFPNSPEEEKVFRLTLQNNSGWYMDTGPNTVQYFIHKENLYGSELGKGIINQLNTGLNDNGKPIPFSVSFRREDVQPGPSRIKKLYLYAISKGTKEETSLYFFGKKLNSGVYNNSETEKAVLLKGTEQHLNVELLVDGKVLTIDNAEIKVSKSESNELAITEPVKIYEVKFRPSLKGHFVQVRIKGLKPEEDIAIIGYGLEYSTRGRVRGIKE